MTELQNKNFPEDQIPPDVMAELKHRYGPVPPVPSSVDDAIFVDARRHLTAPRVVKTAGAWDSKTGRGRAGRIVLWAGSAAAALLLTVSVMKTDRPQPEGLPADTYAFGLASPAVEQRGPDRFADDSTSLSDINHDGRVDILDAFALAKTVESGSGGNEGDMDRDGRLTQSDVKLIATQVVMLQDTFSGQLQ